MRDDGKKKLLEKLQVHHRAFAAQLPEKMETIEGLWHALVEERWSLDTLSTLHRMVHSLAGSSGTFGLPKVGDAAHALEIFLVALARGKAAPTEPQRQEVRGALDLLLATTRADRTQATTGKTKPSEPGDALSSREKGVDRLIYVVEDDTTLARGVADHIRHFGYLVETFETLATFREALAQNEPAVVLMDVGLPDGEGTEAMIEIQKGRSRTLPVVFLTRFDDLMTRLQAVEAGGRAFCPKPVNLSLLIDILDRLTTPYDPAPYRIIIMDDSKSLAEYYALVLNNAGMETRVVTDALLALEPLETFQPDLILLDLHMPGCSGVELAKVIRQQESFVSVPIVFLSGETDLGQHIATISAGGDGFLSKPIKPEHLVQAVSARMERYQKLRSLMTRDSLTGLLNHTRTKECLDAEVDRGKRTGVPVSFAMVDLDKFKNVNDTYGHATGDRVIKSLSRLLKQRLRKTDVVGRYGGEAFAVILPDTTGPAARDILDQLREDFAQVVHQHEKGLFHSTFSCGVASFPAYTDGPSLNNAADEALYAAKHKGRNRVEVAPSPTVE